MLLLVGPITCSIHELERADTEMAKGSTKKSAMARRRRKEKIQSSRSTDTTADTAADAAASPENGSEVPAVPAAPPLPVKKRRKVSEDNVPSAIAPDDKVQVAMIAPAASAKKCTKSTKTGKPMNTYEPDVEMTKEQLAAWRREARRVRNRESAAASRRKTKDRITELEKEVDEYKSKYEAALQKLAQYEGEGDLSGTV